MENLITIEELVLINQKLVSQFGGCGVGFKDENLAISAIDGCNQEAFGIVFYPTILSKINHLVFSIVSNHIFLDGNKRTGTFVFYLMIEKYNIKINFNSFNIEYYILSIAKSEITEEEALKLLNNHLITE
ncbi:type II toxin-antitoxin system death-on-curing family toxin [Clostridium thermobutyricum]|uniref:type II toxin-antitoxin system death-on-curing family toxin n=1 Tax=Clostridium thermobutyricum TaxID=29372 RepID=UPI0018AC28B1|nr:Fic family protein [Clostridium thermobutyricum]